MLQVEVLIISEQRRHFSFRGTHYNFFPLFLCAPCNTHPPCFQILNFGFLSIDSQKQKSKLCKKKSQSLSFSLLFHVKSYFHTKFSMNDMIGARNNIVCAKKSDSWGRAWLLIPTTSKLRMYNKILLSLSICDYTIYCIVKTFIRILLITY